MNDNVSLTTVLNKHISLIDAPLTMVSSFFIYNFSVILQKKYNNTSENDILPLTAIVKYKGRVIAKYKTKM
jgi:hypothetical protein